MKLEEKEIVIKFNVAGYDLDFIDFTEIHNAMMLKATEDLSMFAVVGNFKSEVLTKKVKS